MEPTKSTLHWTFTFSWVTPLHVHSESICMITHLSDPTSCTFRICLYDYTHYTLWLLPLQKLCWKYLYLFRVGCSLIATQLDCKNYIPLFMVFCDIFWSSATKAKCANKMSYNILIKEIKLDENGFKWIEIEIIGIFSSQILMWKK